MVTLALMLLVAIIGYYIGYEACMLEHYDEWEDDDNAEA